MEKQSKNEKKKRIHTQVDERVLTYLKNYAEENNLSISKLIHKALTHYIRFVKKDEISSNPLILIAKTEFAFILKELSEEKIKCLAEIAYNDAIRERKEYIEKYFTKEEKSRFKLTPRILLNTLREQVFGYEGQNWFKEIKENFHEKRLTIGGIHNINKNFSIFFKYYIEKHLLDFKYRLTNEKLDEDRIFLDFSANN